MFTILSVFTSLLRGTVTKAPFVNIVLCIIAGILIQKNQAIIIHTTIACTLLVSLSACVFTCTKLYPHIQLLICYSWFFAFGIIYPSFHTNSYETLRGKHHIIGTLSSAGIEKEKTYAFEIEIESTDTTNQKARAQIYIQKDAQSADLQYGDVIEIQAFFKPIENFGNSSFDYKQFMAEKYIYSTAYVPSKSWIQRNSQQSLQRIGAVIQKNTFEYFKKSNISQNSKSIIYALAFGNKSLLEAHTKKSFASAGAMHILAVSGLHVGIVSSILLLICIPLRHTRWNFLSIAVVISGIWVYASITGLSPSVQRAAIMFSLLSIGFLLKRRVSSYNTIAASACIAILIDPYAFYNVSFQLSYIAVLSILYGVPKLQGIIYTKRKITKYIWGIITVSIAVQIGTFPISVYYFKQIPLYSIITNIFVIPLAFIIITSVIASFIPYISHVIFSLLDTEIKLLHSIIATIHELPKSTIDMNIAMPWVYILYGSMLIGIFSYEIVWELRVQKNGI